MFKVLVVFANLLSLLLAQKFPSDFKLCEITKNPELNICLKSAIQVALPKLKEGIPKLKIESIEPLKIITASFGEGTGPVHIIQNYTDFKLFGVTDTIVDDVDISLKDDGFTLHIKAHSPEYRMESHYTAKGQLLLVPVGGEGECVVSLKDIDVELDLISKVQQRKNKNYYEITSNKLALTPKLVTYKFDNIIRGDQRLSDEINKLLNENWKEVFVDVQSNWETLIGNLIENLVNTIFRQIPADEVYLKPKSNP